MRRADRADSVQGIAVLLDGGCEEFYNEVVEHKRRHAARTEENPMILLNRKEIRQVFTMKDAIVYDDWDIIVMQGGVWELASDTTFTNGDIQKIQDFIDGILKEIKDRTIF